MLGYLKIRKMHVRIRLKSCGKFNLFKQKVRNSFRVFSNNNISLIDYAALKTNQISKNQTDYISIHLYSQICASALVMRKYTNIISDYRILSNSSSFCLLSIKHHSLLFLICPHNYCLKARNCDRFDCI